jgi:hypothetical protein
MTEHESKIDRAAAHGDAYELVGFARTYPGEAPAVDAALAQLVPRLASKRKYHDLAYILTLPERGARWTAVETAIEALVAAGAKANQAAISVALGGSYAAKERVAQVLEGTSDDKRAAKLRDELARQTPGPLQSSATVPDPRSSAAAGFGASARLEVGLLMILGALLVLAGIVSLLYKDPLGLLLLLLGICAVASGVWLLNAVGGFRAPSLSARARLASRRGAYVLAAVGVVIALVGIRLLISGAAIEATKDQNGDYLPNLALPAGVLIALVGIFALVAGISFFGRRTRRPL